MIVVSAGMPRSGTGWIYNLTNDLLVASGQPPALEIRRRYRLARVLREHNCNVGRPSGVKLLALTVPHLLGRSLAVKTHRRPTPAIRAWVALRVAKATYIYRDPRDVVVSAFEAGKSFRDRGVDKSFARLETVEMAIDAVTRWLRGWQAWTSLKRVLEVRYEDWASDSQPQLRRLRDYLGLGVDDQTLQRISARYEKGHRVVGAHLRRGGSGRFLEVLSPQQIELCHHKFGSMLARMGYDSDTVG